MCTVKIYYGVLYEAGAIKSNPTFTETSLTGAGVGSGSRVWTRDLSRIRPKNIIILKLA